MIRQFIKRFILLLSVLLIVSSCKDIDDLDKYQRPDWLVGKLYTQLSSQENLSTFKLCLELTGYDTILDRTGSFTIFAPNDEAFVSFLSAHPEYGGSVENISLPDLRNIVRIHIIQDAWTLNQIQILDVDGWIDPADPKNSKPRAYKRETILQDPDKKYWINNKQGKITIVDSTHANDYRIVYSRSRKYVPIFFPAYFGINDLSSSDYEFFYERSYDYTSIHYANGKVIGTEIFAENGFIYEIDQLVEPLLNTEQILFAEENDGNYNYVRELMGYFPSFKTDLFETGRQPEAKQGLDFDTLYILDYPKLPFNIHEELTGPDLNDDKYTLRYHNGFLAPSDNAFETFINDILTVNSGLPHWSSWDAVPVEIKQIILRNHMSASPIYQTDLTQGFYTGEGDIITIEENSIFYKDYGSNSTFLGLNDIIVPRAFTSVSAPVYLRPGFSYFLYAIEQTKILPALKKQDNDFSFFIIPDHTLNNDSSLVFSWKDRDLNKYEFTAYDRGAEKFQKMSAKLLSKRLLNHVGIRTPDGSANKEFIENLAGNYIVFDNSSAEVMGGAPSIAGYNGGDDIIVTANELAEPTDNGTTYEINGWLLPPKKSIYDALSIKESRSKFLELLLKAGLYNDRSYSFDFLFEGENYTIFVPSEQALIDYGADTLSVEDLEALLRYHFIRGEKIFTDGKMPSGDYQTMRIDESSTPLFPRYTPMSVQPGPDIIDIHDRNDNLIGTIIEADSLTNTMITSDTDPNEISNYDLITTGVLHDIDFVIHK